MAVVNAIATTTIQKKLRDLELETVESEEVQRRQHQHNIL